MEWIQHITEFIFHIDKSLGAIIAHIGPWSYLVIFFIIFAETGFVVTPFLPGDSLLFAGGTLAAIGSFNLAWVLGVILVAAIAGDSLNYAVGKTIGEKMIQKYPRFLKKEYLDRTHRFYEKYGGKTIVLARFIPVVRTFAPFIAGIGTMNYLTFFFYNVTGALLWVAVFVLGGFFFGNIPLIKNNFSLAIFSIILLSVLPVFVEFWKHQRRKKKASSF
jgi:membrane-associated protein